MGRSGETEYGKFYDNPLKAAGSESEHDRVDAEHFDEEARTFVDRLGEDALRVRLDEPMSARHRKFWDLVGDVRGKRALDVGCGAGWASCMLALKGAESVAIDVSQGMIDLTLRAAALNGVKVDARRMSAVKIEFPDEYFDVVVGQVSFHHLPYPTAAREVLRVLKPGGRAVFMDPIHGSRFLLKLRSLFPIDCHESDGGGALRRDHIRELGTMFGSADVTWYGPMARFDRFTILEPVYGLLNGLDRAILAVPGSGWMVSYAVMEFRKQKTA